METYVLSDAFPAELRQVTLALYANLADPAGLRARLIKASTMEGPTGGEERQRLDYAFLDSKMVRLVVPSVSRESDVSGRADRIQRARLDGRSASNPYRKSRGAADTDYSFRAHRSPQSYQ
jgi:EKC/KEOPS complex subunit CGI121/TPRKB